MVNFVAGKNKMKYSSFAMISILVILVLSIVFQIQLQIKEAVPDITDFNGDRYADLDVETRFEDKIPFHTPMAEEFD
jgi:hypothetical protein